MIENILFQVGINELIQPESVTTAVALLIIGLLSIFYVAGLWLRSIVSLFMAMITTVVLSLTILTQLQFLWFWLSVIISSITVVLSMAIWVKTNGRI